MGATAKRQIFLVVRCHRCLQHTRGGEKHEHLIELPADRWQWLERVRERSRHPTIGKTLRIIIDFYKPLCDNDASFQDAFFSVASQPHVNAQDTLKPTVDASVEAVDSSLVDESQMGA